MGIYKNIIARFPRGGLSFSFAYGSGVKQQLGYEAVANQKNNIIDIIFCVRDPLGWHAENINRHPSHYSALRFLGSETVMRYQEQLGAGVYFNTLVPLPDVDVTIKYGVISYDQLLDDLKNWKHIYLAGRLHKPVHHIIPSTHDVNLTEAIETNLIKAFEVALILLPERFTCFQLFHTICNLSYKGDFRMIFGENKKKAQNIVLGQEKDFFELYRPALEHLSDYVAADFSAKELGSGKSIIQFEQDKSVKANEMHLRCLPGELQKRLVRNAAFRGSYAEIVGNLASSSNLDKLIQMSINDIVWKSSISQSLKNIPSAGILKSIIYSYRKAMKTFA